MQERLQKFLAQAGVASRRDAEKIIMQNRVKVNGKIVNELGSKVDPNKDKVFVDGKKVAIKKKLYYIFNKPRGVVTTLSDPEKRKTIGDFIKELPERVFSVGRLDYNTEGLLLLTNDGELSQMLMHPKYHVNKTYRVSAVGIVKEELLDKLRVGIRLEDGVTAPALVNIIEYQHEKNLTLFDITIHEGKNRQVRRMCDAIGHPVRYLKRTKFAGIVLNDLKRGKIRELEKFEVQNLYKLVQEQDDV